MFPKDEIVNVSKEEDIKCELIRENKPTVLIENTRRPYILRAGSLLLQVDAITEACVEVALEILHIRLDLLELVLLLVEVFSLLLNEALIVLGGSVLIDIDQCLTNE
jgi:hypothetical protein